MTAHDHLQPLAWIYTQRLVLTHSGRSRLSVSSIFSLTFLIAKTVIRVAIALVISIVWINSIPAYGMPFGGCDVYGLTTFELGCSTWPEFIRGFGFVMIWLLIAPAHTWLHLFVLLLLAIFSVSYEVMINGLELLQDADGWRFVIAQILPIMLGGLVAFGIFSGVRRFAQKRENQPNDC